MKILHSSDNLVAPSRVFYQASDEATSGCWRYNIVWDESPYHTSAQDSSVIDFRGRRLFNKGSKVWRTRMRLNKMKVSYLNRYQDFSTWAGFRDSGSGIRLLQQ